MGKTFGHTGSRSCVWKHHRSHSSNKLNKEDSHKRVRKNVRDNISLSTYNKIDLEMNYPEKDHKKACGLSVWENVNCYQK